MEKVVGRVVLKYREGWWIHVRVEHPRTTPPTKRDETTLRAKVARIVLDTGREEQRERERESWDLAGYT